MLDAKARRGGSGLVLGTRLADGGREHAQVPHDDVANGGGPRRARLPASIAYPCSRPPETTTGRRGARDARDGHEQGACILVHGEALVMVSDVLHELLDASEPPARAFAAPIRAVEKAAVWRWRSGAGYNQSTNSRLQSSDASTCRRITVRKLDGRRGLRKVVG